MKYLKYVTNNSNQYLLQKNGYGDLVVMSMETYEELLSTDQIDKAIFEAEREVAEGAELLDAREALGELRRKHFG